MHEPRLLRSLRGDAHLVDIGSRKNNLAGPRTVCNFYKMEFCTIALRSFKYSANEKAQNVLLNIRLVLSLSRGQLRLRFVGV